MANGTDKTLSAERALQDSTGRDAPYLFLVTDSEQPTAGSSRHLLSGVDEVLIGRGLTRELSRSRDGRRLQLAVADPRMSSRHARLARSGETFVVEDLGSKNGTVVNGVSQTRALLADGDVIELGYTFFVYRARLAETVVHDTGVKASDGLTSLLPSLASQFDKVKAIASSTLSLLIRGPSGTGKELVARAAHRLSGRNGPFVAVNCGAIAAALVESEFFGYRKGAFSGASEDRTGLIRAADGGTLFLDEIGDLALSAQAVLLRVLQEREVLPVGATKPIPVDLRVVAATHRDLDAMASMDRFRPDLLPRLRGFEIGLPPLSERREDFGLIVAALLERVQKDKGVRVTFSQEAMRALLAHSWPSNVRELEQCLSAAAILSNGRILPQQLPEHIRSPQGVARQAPEPERDQGDRPTRDQLAALFAKHRGNVHAVARETGKDRVQIRRWLKLYDIDPASFRR